MIAIKVYFYETIKLLYTEFSAILRDQIEDRSIQEKKMGKVRSMPRGSTSGKLFRSQVKAWRIHFRLAIEESGQSLEDPLQVSY